MQDFAGTSKAVKHNYLPPPLVVSKVSTINAMDALDHRYPFSNRLIDVRAYHSLEGGYGLDGKVYTKLPFIQKMVALL